MLLLPQVAPHALVDRVTTAIPSLPCTVISSLHCDFFPSAAACAPACSEVLQPCYLPRSPQLAFLTMEVLVEGQQEQQAQAAGGNAAEGLGGSAPAVQQAAMPAAEARLRQQQQALAPDGSTERLVFLYRLVPGHAAPSFGVYCAQLAGIPLAVLQRARHVITAQARVWVV